MKWIRKILGKDYVSKIEQKPEGMVVKSRQAKIKNAAEDFATRFEGVMEELSKG